MKKVIITFLLLSFACTKKVEKLLSSVEANGESACGNSIVDPNEQCDGTNLNGNSCQTLGFDSGNLTCRGGDNFNACTFNTSSCELNVTGNNIVINPYEVYQLMDGVGACSYAFPYANDQGWSWDSIRKYVTPNYEDNLDLQYIRMAPWLSYFEPANDNSDPFVIDWNAYRLNWADGWNIPVNHDLKFALSLYNESGITPELGIWSAGWITPNNRISSGNYLELGEMISAYLLNFADPKVDRSAFNIPQTWTGFKSHVVEIQNEPAIEAAIQYESPVALRDAALSVLDQLDHFGLSQVKLHGPNFHRPEGTTEWASVWFANERLKERTEALSYHTWWDGDSAESTYRAIWDLASAHGKPVWATEIGYCALSTCQLDGKTHYLDPSRWETAWDYAKSYYRAISWSHASRVYHWALFGHDAVVGETGEKLPSYYILRHMSKFIPAGAHFVANTSYTNGLKVMVFALPAGGYSAIILNESDSSETFSFRVNGGINLSITQFKSSVRDSYFQDGTLDNTGKIATLTPQSVSSFIIE